MRLHISNIVAIAAFIACVDKSSVEAKAVAEFHSARTGTTTDFALVERRLRSAQLKGGEERAGGGLETVGDVAVKAIEKFDGRVSLTLLHEQKPETSIVKKLAAAYEEKLKEMQAWDGKKKLDILRTEDLKSLSENEQYLGAIVAEQFIRSGVENQVAKGRAYLDRLVKQWEGKSVHDVAKIVLPDTTELDVDGVVVLRHFIENSKTEEKVTNKVLIDALRTRYGSDTQLSKVVLEAIKKTDKKGLETKSEYDLNREGLQLYVSFNRSFARHLLVGIVGRSGSVRSRAYCEGRQGLLSSNVACSTGRGVTTTAQL
uniref:RxLR effector candidate protein n=1 Tax=Hyaloperonospora arabidopsidis (strain Emoy2) TaxID=559515 RepID=A0A090BBA9_HYAAE|nr:RxLR effector candidate protein [Hyaloperonospora arabidopsidis Emoy2]